MKAGFVVPSGVFRRGARVRGAALLAAALFAAPAAGQGTAADSARPPAPSAVLAAADSGAAVSGAGRHTGSSPLVAAGHWAVRAARRAEALGWARDYLPAQAAVPRHAVADALEQAAHAAPAGAQRRLAAGWLARFAEEFPEYAAPRGAAYRPGAAVHAEYLGREGRLSPTIGYAQDRQDPRPVPDLHTPRLRAEAGMGAGAFALWAEARADRRGLALPRWEALAGVGAFSFSVGSREVGFGPGVGGAVVLFPGDPLLRVQAQTARPVRLPGFLRHAGPVSMHLFTGPTRDPGRHPEQAWLWGARLAVQPHPRLTLAANRSSIFGTAAEPVTAFRVVRMLAGVIRHGDFENQIASFDARWRLPTDAVLPATVYAEVGADDGAGAFDEMPGVVAGVFLPALPALPQLALGAEYTRFPEACCGHGPWYFNASQRGGWARLSRPLGHPMGGQGREALGYAHAELFDARLRVEGRGFRRERSGADLVRRGGANLFAPQRAGRSTGAALDAALRLGRVDLRAGGYRDQGDGWREQWFHLGASAFIHE
ncbi:MAG TPA: capsule assembly Wzi family protein [Longimicrobium sp.]|jgi:hypothetical protein|uniref:capsule assembly Wzi family protein n=1 Tax=Longimicrobium sp. TaxID=2029185 RepID=UPI002ED939DF